MSFKWLLKYSNIFLYTKKVRKRKSYCEKPLHDFLQTKIFMLIKNFSWDWIIPFFQDRLFSKSCRQEQEVLSSLRNSGLKHGASDSYHTQTAVQVFKLLILKLFKCVCKVRMPRTAMLATFFFSGFLEIMS